MLAVFTVVEAFINMVIMIILEFCLGDKPVELVRIGPWNL